MRAIYRAYDSTYGTVMECDSLVAILSNIDWDIEWCKRNGYAASEWRIWLDCETWDEKKVRS